jgi:hypothetical protein
VSNNVVIEVGKISILQAGLLTPPDLPQSYDRDKVVLLVMNDPADVRYEVYAGTRSVSIKPGDEAGDCCLIATAPGLPLGRRALLYPSRLIGHQEFGHSWPTEWFQSAGASVPDGPYRTAFGLVADDYAWSWSDDNGLPTYNVAMPLGTRVFKVVRSAQSGGADDVTEVLAGQSIDSIRLVRGSGPLQNNGGEPWPP